MKILYVSNLSLFICLIFTLFESLGLTIALLRLNLMLFEFISSVLLNRTLGSKVIGHDVRESPAQADLLEHRGLRRVDSFEDSDLISHVSEL